MGRQTRTTNRVTTVDKITEAELQPCELYVKTTAFQYAQALRMILKANPELTLTQLAAKVDRSVRWVKAKLKIQKEEKEKMKIFWDDKHSRTGLYELRAHPAAMVLKLRKMSGGGWLVNCLGEATELSGSFSDEQAKNAAIGWMLPILDNLRDSLDKLHAH